MALSEQLKLEVSRTQLRRLETLTDCVYAVALVLVIQWLPLPHESSLTGGPVRIGELFAEHLPNLAGAGIGLIFIIIYWMRSNTRMALLERTDAVHTAFSITSVFFLLFLLYVVRVGAEVEDFSGRAAESVAVAMIGLPAAVGWWHAHRRGLIREGVTAQEKRGEFVEAFTEPVTALITVPFAFMGELYWNLAWLSYIPVAALLRRRNTGHQ